MYRKLIFLLTLILMLAMANTASAILPPLYSSQDIGDDGQPGSADQAGGEWTVAGSGHDIWDDNDDFHYCYKSYTGDLEISARVISITGGSHEWTKAGVMIRETLADNSAHRFMALSNNQSAAHAAAYQGRATSGSGSQSNHANQQPAGYAL